MKQAKFFRLLNRYLKGTVSPKEELLVEAYFDELEKGPVRSKTPQEEEAIQARILQRLQSGIKQKRGLVIPLARRWQLSAAAVLLVIGFSVWYLAIRPSAGGPVEQETGSAAPLLLPRAG